MATKTPAAPRGQYEVETVSNDDVGGTSMSVSLYSRPDGEKDKDLTAAARASFAVFLESLRPAFDDERLQALQKNGALSLASPLVAVVEVTDPEVIAHLERSRVGIVTKITKYVPPTE